MLPEKVYTRPFVSTPSFAAIVLFIAVLSWTDTALSGPPKCRGTKVLYAGVCRYPDEVRRLKALAAKRAEQQRHKAAEEQRKAKELQEKDRAACESARKSDALGSWAKYLAEHPMGSCHSEAAKRISELNNARVVAPTPVGVPSSSEPKPTEPIVPPSTPADEPDESEPSAGLSPLVYVGFGVGGAALLVGAITGGISLSNASTLQDECGGDVCPTDRQEDIDSMITLANVSNVSFALAGVGAAVGLIALLVFDSDESKAQEATVKPQVGVGFMGFSGRF